MCSPDVLLNTIKITTNSAMNIFDEYSNNKAIKQEQNYRTQIAINNIKNAQNEGRRQQQLGIEKSRSEKIAGLRQAQDIVAQNAANGFISNSGTNYLQYEDVVDDAYQNANSAINQYNSNADVYFKKANSYLNDLNTQIKAYNSNLIKNNYNSLGNYYKVAKNWYSDVWGNDNEYI